MVADIVSMVGMKAHALGRPLKLDKHGHDLYAICGFAKGGPSGSAKEFTTKVRRKLVKREKVFLQEALARTREYLRSENSRGPLAVSRFYGMDPSKGVDSYRRVSIFLDAVQSS
jgi:hypothetical protein